MSSRISRPELFMEMAELMAKRSTCTRAQVGCVITKDDRIVCTGYNGAPSGMPHCTDVGCEGTEGCERCLHAEAAAISFAASKGIALEDTVMYVTHAPCYSCAKLIINAGINMVWFLHPYRDQRGMQLLLDQAVRVRLMGRTDAEWKVIYGHINPEPKV